MNLRVNLEDDWLQVKGYIPEHLRAAIVAHEARKGTKCQPPGKDVLQRLIRLSDKEAQKWVAR